MTHDVNREFTDVDGKRVTFPATVRVIETDHKNGIVTLGVTRRGCPEWIARVTLVVFHQCCAPIPSEGESK